MKHRKILIVRVIFIMIGVEAMNVTELMARLLGLTSLWSIEKIQLSEKQKKMYVHVACVYSTEVPCPICSEPIVSIWDINKSVKPYIPLFEYNTCIVYQERWAACPEHGAQQIKPPWEDKLKERLLPDKTAFYKPQHAERTGWRGVLQSL